MKSTKKYMRIVFKRFKKETTTFSVYGDSLSVCTESIYQPGGCWNLLSLKQAKRLYKFLGKAVKELENREKK